MKLANFNIGLRSLCDVLNFPPVSLLLSFNQGLKMWDMKRVTLVLVEQGTSCVVTIF